MKIDDGFSSKVSGLCSSSLLGRHGGALYPGKASWRASTLRPSVAAPAPLSAARLFGIVDFRA